MTARIAHDLEARFDRALKTPGPRVSIRPSRPGTDYTIRHNGSIVASGWTAGGRADAMRMATVRCEEWERSGSWQLEVVP